MKPLAFVAPTPVAAPSRLAVSRVAQSRPSYGELSQPPRSRRLVLVGVAALHLLGLWGLSQMQDVRRAVARVAPVVVRLVAPAEPPKPLPPPPMAMPELKVPATTLIEPPLIAIAVAPAPSPVVAALPPPPPVVVQAQVAPAPPVVQVAPPPAPQIKQIPASAVRYLKEPRMTVPLMSKRLRESGVVHLRVVVDVRGQPREITLAKSSGYTRLDEQALLDMRSARFAPYMENGQPVEWEVIAPMSYEVDR
ncbi:TonB family protein [Roseateles sp.]|uniref:TonB family protein n=1 Tax=Roseateles sp. TaxID=1971397 RepID=UPI0039EB0910